MVIQFFTGREKEFQRTIDLIREEETGFDILCCDNAGGIFYDSHVLVFDDDIIRRTGTDTCRAVSREVRKRGGISVIGVPDYPGILKREIVMASGKAEQLKAEYRAEGRTVYPSFAGEENKDAAGLDDTAEVSGRSDPVTADEEMISQEDCGSNKETAGAPAQEHETNVCVPADETVCEEAVYSEAEYAPDEIIDDADVWNEKELVSNESETCGYFERYAVAEEEACDYMSGGSEPLKISSAHEEVLNFESVRRIGVIGAGACAGASFVSSSLALELAGKAKRGKQPKNSVAIVSVDDTEMFEMTGIEKHFTEKPFFKYTEAVKAGSPFGSASNTVHNVNWVIRSPEDICGQLTVEEKRRLIGNIGADYIIIDHSQSAGTDAFRELAEDLDMIICVIDPLPSKVIINYELIEMLKETDKPVIFVMNRSNGGVRRREILGFLDMKQPDFTIPHIRPELVYAAEYNSMPLYLMPEVRKETGSVFASIAKEVRRDAS